MLTATQLKAGYTGKEICTVPELQIEAGHIAAVMGPSGCGKTTLLKTLSGELPPISGCFHISGDQSVARTIQGAPLLHWLTVRENAKLAAHIRGNDDVDVARILASLGISDLADAYPDRLSGGERVRASLSQALTSNPAALLLDEPFSQLDFAAKRQAANTTFSYVRKRQIATIFVTHDISDAIAFSDKIFVLSSGVPSQLRTVDVPHESLRAADIEDLMEVQPCDY